MGRPYWNIDLPGGLMTGRSPVSWDSSQPNGKTNRDVRAYESHPPGAPSQGGERIGGYLALPRGTARTLGSQPLRPFTVDAVSLRHPTLAPGNADRDLRRFTLAGGYALAFPLWAIQAYARHQPRHPRPRGSCTAPRVFPDRTARFPLGRMADGPFSRHPANGRCGSFPYLAGVASLLLFWRFCRAGRQPADRVAGGRLMAASFYPVRHSTEVKPYAIDLLVSLMLLIDGLAASRNLRSRRAWTDACSPRRRSGSGARTRRSFRSRPRDLFLESQDRSTSDPIALDASGLCLRLLMTLNWGIVFVTFARPQAERSQLFRQLGDTWNRCVSAAGGALATPVVVYRCPHRQYGGVSLWRQQFWQYADDDPDRRAAASGWRGTGCADRCCYCSWPPCQSPCSRLPCTATHTAQAPG